MREMKASGISWLGELPSNWELRKIKYCLQERVEKNNPVRTTEILSLTAKQGVIPYDQKEGGGNKPKEDVSAYRLAYPGDIVMNSMNILSGSVGLSQYFGCVSPVYYMPDYTAMGDVLKNVASEGRFPGKDVVTWLRLVMDTTDKIKVHAELDIVIPHIDVNAEYTKANVMGLFKGITTKKEVVRYVFENTGIMLYAYLRGEEERREYLSGNIDINYFDYDDTHAKYSVGEIGNGMKYTIERASVVREIQAVEGSKLIFKKVLPLMGVEFVRYGMLTVVPFPFKYLREYIVKEEKSV